MSSKLDARGLACPQPVLMTLNELKKGRADEVEILADSEAAKENILRAATSQGWNVSDISEDNGEYKITIIKD